MDLHLCNDFNAFWLCKVLYNIICTYSYSGGRVYHVNCHLVKGNPRLSYPRTLQHTDCCGGNELPILHSENNPFNLMSQTKKKEQQKSAPALLNHSKKIIVHPARTKDCTSKTLKTLARHKKRQHEAEQRYQSEALLGSDNICTSELISHIFVCWFQNYSMRRC